MTSNEGRIVTDSLNEYYRDFNDPEFDKLYPLGEVLYE